MAEFSGLQEEVLQDLFRLQSLTHRDSMISLDLLKPRVQPANEGQIESSEFFFWLKTCIRSFLGEIDAVGFVLRRAVVRAGPKLAPSISNRELAKLSERRYDSVRDEVTDERVRPLSTLESLKLGLRYFPRLFRADWSPEFKKSGGWQALQRLADARHDFTHPDRLEKLRPRDAFVFIEPALRWYAGVMGRLLIECAHEVDPELYEQRGRAAPDSVVVPKVPEEPHVLDAEFYDEVQSSLDKLIAYSTAMLTQLGSDTRRAITLLRDLPDYQGKGRAEVEQSNEYQFATRNLLRTLFSEVEGTIGYIEFLLTSAAQKGHLVSEAELTPITEGELEERLLAALNLWSAKLGSGEVVEPKGAGWQAFLLAKKWRNKVTHPTQVMDFLLLPSVMTKIQDGAWWFLLDARSVLAIREDRLPTPW